MEFITGFITEFDKDFINIYTMNLHTAFHKGICYGNIYISLCTENVYLLSKTQKAAFLCQRRKICVGSKTQRKPAFSG